ncbi:MAG: ABC transporter permease [Bacillota bacterium]|nr:ABC transporter permease [Bacillota bacterium]
MSSSSKLVAVGLQLLALVLAVVGALAVGALLLLMVGADPVKAYRAMFLGPLGGRYGATELLVRATPLLLVSLGIVVSFRASVLNIGAEGQIIAGAVAGTAVALAIPQWPGWMLSPLVFLVGAAAGAGWGALAGWLKARLAVNEILSTIMLNQIALHLSTFLIRGPLMDPAQTAYGAGYPQTALLPRQVWLPRLISGSRAHVGFLLAIVAAVLVFVLLWRTVVGYRLRAVGAGPEAARYAGINVGHYLVLAMALAGAFGGFAGVVEVVGVHHRLLDGISAGYGFSGIVVALLGRLHPLGCLPAALFFGMLVLGADMMQRAVAIPAAIVMAIEGLVILSVVSTDFLVSHPERLLALAARLARIRPSRRLKEAAR